MRIKIIKMITIMKIRTELKESEASAKLKLLTSNGALKLALGP